MKTKETIQVKQKILFSCQNINNKGSIIDNSVCSFISNTYVQIQLLNHISIYNCKFIRLNWRMPIALVADNSNITTFLTLRAYFRNIKRHKRSFIRSSEYSFMGDSFTLHVWSFYIKQKCNVPPTKEPFITKKHLIIDVKHSYHASLYLQNRKWIWSIRWNSSKGKMYIR